ncbi:MAG: hypothetical protein QNI92_02180 [Desulfobacterales bacterium]|nr:hypothetical protein [Desulfobacterales bacterium]MDJ0914614.1 hypothetical protein [Desulfobacterales bacterium]
MAGLNFDLMAPSLMVLLTLAIYIVIIIVFLNARRKYKGGVVEKVINLIIATVGFLLVADLALFLVPLYSFNISYPVHVVFKIVAMTCLAVGGLKFFVK